MKKTKSLRLYPRPPSAFIVNSLYKKYDKAIAGSQQSEVQALKNLTPCLAELKKTSRNTDKPHQ